MGKAGLAVVGDYLFRGNRKRFFIRLLEKFSKIFCKLNKPGLHLAIPSYAGW